MKLSLKFKFFALKWIVLVDRGFDVLTIFLHKHSVGDVLAKFGEVRIGDAGLVGALGSRETSLHAHRGGFSAGAVVEALGGSPPAAVAWGLEQVQAKFLQYQWVLKMRNFSAFF